MQIRISSPRHYEILYGSSDLIHAYLEQIEKRVEIAIPSEVLGILRISLLIAQPEELAQGLFTEYQKFDWKCGYAAVGVNGDFERYHLGNDWDKICELSEMLKSAFKLIGKKRKAQFDAELANEIVIQTTHYFMENHSKK